MKESYKTLSQSINEMNQAFRNLMVEMGVYRLLELLNAVLRNLQKNNRK